MRVMLNKPLILIPSRGAEDWKRLLRNSKRQSKKDRSAERCAQCWENAIQKQASGLPTEIASILGPEAKLLLAIPEHEVCIPPNRKWPSKSDVFALVRIADSTCALAVEAKVDETFDRKIGDLRKNPANDGGRNREARWRTLCDTLGAKAPPPDHLYNQLLHRTASAIYEAERFNADLAAMIVHWFPPLNGASRDGFKHFAEFCNFLGINQVSRGTPMWKTLPCGRDLLLGWAQADS